MKLKDLVLIALICANVTLAAVAGALLASRAQPEAHAAVQSRAGDYIMVTGSVTGSREALLVIDQIAKRANVYMPQAGAGAGGTKWQLVTTRSLENDFAGR